MSLDFESGGSEWVDLVGTLSALQNVVGGTACVWALPESVSALRSPFGFSTGTSVTNSRINIEQTVANNWTCGGRRLDADAFSLATLGAVAAGTLYHLAVVLDYDGQEVRGYINGALVVTFAVAGWTGNSSNTESLNAAIAADDDGSGRYYDGLLDDLRIYNRTLSDDEIALIYAARGHDNLIDGLVHRWALGEEAPGVAASGAGTVMDKMGSVNGTPTNTPTYAEEIVAHRRRRAA